MVTFRTHMLDNGLRLIHHYDASTRMVAVNLLYDVGSGDEEPTRTGLAHLMEHLMFSGSKHVAKHDEILQKAGGDSNAWTNIDVTNYYDILPAHNLETALWLESDRLLNLMLTEENIKTQKSVVIEEFKQRYLNQPYGDVLHLTHGQAYTKHPYRWPTIGLDIKTIENFTITDIIDFYHKYYCVNNMVMCVSGNVDFDTTLRLVEKWFGDIAPHDVPRRSLPVEPIQQEPRWLNHHSDVPNNLIFRTYHMCGRNHDDYQACDILSDILSNGMSSRFYKELIMQTNLFADIDASVLGSRDPGLFYIKARLNSQTTFDEAQLAIDKVLNDLITNGVSEYEIEKCVNKFESNRLFENIGYAEKAVALCRSELLSNAHDINSEIDKYRNLTPEKLNDVAHRVLDTNNCSTIFYGPNA